MIQPTSSIRFVRAPWQSPIRRQQGPTAKARVLQPAELPDGRASHAAVPAPSSVDTVERQPVGEAFAPPAQPAEADGREAGAGRQPAITRQPTTGRHPMANRDAANRQPVTSRGPASPTPRTAAAPVRVPAREVPLLHQGAPAISGRLAHIGPPVMPRVPSQAPVERSRHLEHQPAAATGIRGAKILIADDEPGVRQVLRRVLTADLRAEVEEASDGLSVLAALQTATFDLVIMDIQMGPLDGLDTLEAIRRVASTRALPVVMITANADAARVTRLRELGVADIIAKPFSLSVLRDRLVPVLSRSALPAGVLRESSRWRPCSSDRVVVVGEDSATARLIHSVLGQVCDVRHDTSVVTALRDIARRPPSVIFLTSSDPLLPPSAFAKAVRRSPAAQSRLFMCPGARSPESGAASDAFDGELPHATDALGFVRALRPHVSDGGMARLLVSTDALLAGHLTETIRGSLERRLGSSLRVVTGPPSAGDYDARSVEATVTFDVDNHARRLAPAGDAGDGDPECQPDPRHQHRRRVRKPLRTSQSAIRN